MAQKGRLAKGLASLFPPLGQLLDLLDEHGIAPYRWADATRPTTTKTRFILRRDWREYSGCTVIKANRIEAAESLGCHVGDPPAMMARRLAIRHGCHVVDTVGELGLWWSDGQAVRRVPAVPVQVRDVCGAGDTVLATLGVVMATGGTIGDGCQRAVREAAWQVVQTGVLGVGRTTTITGAAPVILPLVRTSSRPPVHRMVRHVSVSTSDDSTPLDDGPRPLRWQTHLRRIGPRSRGGSDGFRQLVNQSSSVSSPSNSSGVQMIGIGMPKSLRTP
jgi:hypothetical protein